MQLSLEGITHTRTHIYIPYPLAGMQGTTVISIAHRLALAKYHQKRLHIVGDGSGEWRVETLH